MLKIAAVAAYNEPLRRKHRTAAGMRRRGENGGKLSTGGGQCRVMAPRYFRRENGTGI